MSDKIAPDTNRHQGVSQSMRRGLYKLLGLLFLAIAGLGVVLPLLPATPFLLLCAWFFARSSKRWHDWLLANAWFGPLLHNWEANRCVSRRTKAVAIASMLVVGSASITFAMSAAWLRLTAFGLMAIGCAVILSLRTCARAE